MEEACENNCRARVTYFYAQAFPLLLNIFKIYLVTQSL